MDAFEYERPGIAQDINQLLSSSRSILNWRHLCTGLPEKAKKNPCDQCGFRPAGRSAASEANLWLDSVTDFDPPEGTLDVLIHDEC